MVLGRYNFKTLNRNNNRFREVDVLLQPLHLTFSWFSSLPQDGTRDCSSLQRPTVHQQNKQSTNTNTNSAVVPSRIIILIILSIPSVCKSVNPTSLHIKSPKHKHIHRASTQLNSINPAAVSPSSMCYCLVYPLLRTEERDDDDDDEEGESTTAEGHYKKERCARVELQPACKMFTQLNIIFQQSTSSFETNEPSLSNTRHFSKRNTTEPSEIEKS